MPPSVSSWQQSGIRTVTRGSLRRAGFRVGWPFPEMPGASLSVRLRTSVVASCPACAQCEQAHTTRRVPASSAVGDAFRSRPARTSRAPSTGFSKTAPPSTTPGVHSSGVSPASARRSQRRARSVLAVPPGLDGFLLRMIRGLVASHSRSWGSPGFSAPGPHACERLRASPPMPALQSFPLPRSRGRVTATLCPPAVHRQRRCSSEALLRSGIRGDDDPWPGRAARCSPGLPSWNPVGPRTLRHAR